MNVYDFDECILLDNNGKNTVKIEPRELCISPSFSMGGDAEIEIRGVLRDYDWKPRRQRIDYSKMYGAIFWEMPKIKDVIFNDPATIVFWADGTKTVVKCQDDDIFDPEKGLAMAITKKALGNKGNYCNVFRKWLPKEEEPTIAVTIEPFNVDEMHASLKRAIKNIENACKQKKEK